MNCDRKRTTRNQSAQSNAGESNLLSMNCMMKMMKKPVSIKLGLNKSSSKVLRADAVSFEPTICPEYSPQPNTKKDLSADAQVFIPSQSFDYQESSEQFKIKRIEEVNFDFSLELINPSVKMNNKDQKIENILCDKIEKMCKLGEKLDEKTEENTENSSESSEKASKRQIKNGKILKNSVFNPKKRLTYDQFTIFSLRTIFEQNLDFCDIPQILKEVINRPIILKNSKTLKETSIDDTKAILRKSKTIEEQKILSQAKEYRKRFSISEDERILITKSIKMTLNKLSPNNIQKLSLSLLETCKKSHAYLKLVVSGIFEKAWSEKKYTQMYSDLCKTLKTELENFKYPEINLPKTQNYFKYELLKLCEETFSYLNKDLKSLTLVDSDQQHIGKVKMKTLGNVRFIGELFKVNLISAKIVLECINGLLDLFESEHNEDKLEGACLLLLTGGSTFERINIKPVTSKIFERLETLMKSSISSRIKFKIVDLTEFRANNWENIQKEPVQ